MRQHDLCAVFNDIVHRVIASNPLGPLGRPEVPNRGATSVGSMMDSSFGPMDSVSINRSFTAATDKTYHSGRRRHTSDGGL